MPTAKRTSDCSGRVGLEIDVAVDDDAEQRLARARSHGAELGRTAAHETGDRRPHLRAPNAHEQFLPLGVARLAVGFGDVERIVRGGELRLRGLHRRLALLDVGERHHAVAELLGARVVARRPFHLRVGLGDEAPGLRDRGVGALDGCVVLGEQGVELGAVQAGEHLALLHPVAVLRVEFDDGKTVDPRRNLRFLPRNERARDEEPVDEFAALGRRDGDGGRRRSAGRFRGRGAVEDAIRASHGQAHRAGFLHGRRAGLHPAVAPARGEEGGQESENAEDASHRGASVPFGSNAPAHKALSRRMPRSTSCSASKSGSSACRFRSPPK